MVHDDDNETVLYEVNLEADAAIEGPFDTWLRDHIADMLQIQGFLSAEILDEAAAPPGRVRRIVQYRLRDQAALDRYLREQAPAMRQHGITLFGDRFTTERRLLAHREEFIRGAVSTENCLNCGEVLTGQHCAHCGQRAKVRVLSLAGLLRDLFGDLANFDSRLWRTLVPLAFRPGLLTSEFLRGRRTHYTPPFRMYLTLSVVFFLATTLGASPGDAVKFDVGPDGANLQLDDGKAPQAPAPVVTESTPAARPAKAAAAPPTRLDPERQKVADAIIARLPAASRAEARKDLEQQLAGLRPDQLEPVQNMVNDPCGDDSLKLDIGPLGEEYEPRMREACRKIVADSKGFGRALYSNLPKMMFIFLPLIAAVMYVLYLGSGRYYVEHLLFFVHYHAFFFLAGLLVVLLDRTGAWLAGTAAGSALKAAEGIVATVLVVYVPYYLYRGMHRVYGQGHLVTLLKYSMLGIGYVFFMAITAVGLLVYTAMTL